MAIDPSEETTPSSPPPPSDAAPRQPPAAVKAPAGGRSARAYRHSRPVFDRQIRIHSEYARRLVSLRQFRPTMTALYGIDVILRIVATDEEADQFETVITQRLEELSAAILAERERWQLELERHDLLKARPRYTHPVDLKVQIASPHIGAYTQLILELDQVMIAIDTLWLSGLLSSKARTEIEVTWRTSPEVLRALLALDPIPLDLEHALRRGRGRPDPQSDASPLAGLAGAALPQHGLRVVGL